MALTRHRLIKNSRQLRFGRSTLRYPSDAPQPRRIGKSLSLAKPASERIKKASASRRYQPNASLAQIPDSNIGGDVVPTSPLGVLRGDEGHTSRSLHEAGPCLVQFHMAVTDRKQRMRNFYSLISASVTQGLQNPTRRSCQDPLMINPSRLRKKTVLALHLQSKLFTRDLPTWRGIHFLKSRMLECRSMELGTTTRPTNASFVMTTGNLNIS